MTTLLYRDLRLMFRDPRGWLLAIVFFALFLSLFAIGLRGDAEWLRKLAAPIFWLALIFSLLLTFQSIFDRDIQSGSFEQLGLSGMAPLTIVTSKFLAGIIISVVPLLLILPVTAMFYQLTISEIAALLTSVILGSPALIAYSILSAALMAGQRSAGFLVILLTVPFLIPVMIFALAGIENYAATGPWNIGFQALSGISLIATAISLPGAAMALNTYSE